MTTLFSPSAPRAGLWALLALSASVSAQSDLLDNRLGGRAAIEFLGSDLARVAEEHSIPPAELVSALRNDPTLWVSEDQRLFVVDTATAPGGDDESPALGASIPPEDAFNLSSNPGADKTIYMDFTGHQSVSNSWGHNITFPPYNTSGSSASFSTGELEEIITWWLYVVEDFSPFDVNVTTVEPPLSDLTRNGSGDQRYGMRCVITQSTSGFGDGIGGVALLNSFNDSIDNPCFAFNKGNNTGSMTVSHEVGHTFGLVHDGLNGSSYHPGTQGWGPIMGAPFGSSLVQWSNGDYSGATTSQNDIQIITNSSNGIDLYDDDHGDTSGSATPVPPGVGCPVPAPGSVDGVIERRNDVDAFSFSTSGGTVTISATPTAPGGNVDIDLTLLDGSGSEVLTETPTNTQSVTVTPDLAAGNYTILIDGGEKAGVYSDYGSRGAYTVSVNAQGSGISNLGGGVPGTSPVVPSLLLSGTPCAGNLISYTLVAAPPNALANLVIGVSELSAPFKGGILVPDPSAPGFIIPLTTSFLGLIQLSSTWPDGLPPGFEIFMQYWIVDSGAAEGFAVSDGFRIAAP